MIVRLVAVGKLREPYLVAACDDFRARLRPYHRLEEVEVPAARGDDAAAAVARESAAVLRVLDPADQVWLLERTGHEFSSEELAARGDDAAAAVARESAAVLRVLDPADHVWLLERTGHEFSSEELAARLERLAVEGVGRITFVVAGTHGASEALQRRADVRWSLSRLTFLHEWARALVLEQLYRAARIARGEPYHH